MRPRGTGSRPATTTTAASGREANGKAGRSSPSGPGKRGDAMIRIAITAEAFEAIASTQPLGNVAY
jgi:hypothetical protein